MLSITDDVCQLSRYMQCVLNQENFPIPLRHP